MSSIVKSIARETKILKEFSFDFKNLYKDFSKFLKAGRKLRKSEKEDIRDFKEDIPAFEAFIKECEGKELKFREKLDKGTLSAELFGEWIASLNEAKSTFRTFAAQLSLSDVDIAIAEDEEYEKDEFFTAQGITLIYNAYVRPLYRRYMMTSEENNLDSEGEQEQ